MELAFSIRDVYGVLPELIVAVGASLLLILDIFLPRCRKNIVGYCAIVITVLAALTTCCALQVSEAGPVMAGMFNPDLYSLYFKVVFYISVILTIILSLHYTKCEDLDHRGEYYALILFALCGMTVMASGTNLLTIYLGMELMALPIYVLVGFLKTSKRSNEAAMKYLILGAFSSGLLLYGISLIYGMTGSTDLAAISAAITAGTVSPTILTFGIILLIAGLCFKLAGFPFHIWAPDAYEGAPTTITAFMTVGAKAAAFAAVVRIFLVALDPVYADWKLILTIIALLSMFYGNTVAIAQTNIKRMLAYSSIGHAGYGLLGVVAGTAEGASAIMFYMLVYAFMNLGAFGVIFMMRGARGGGEDINDFRGLARKNTGLAILMLIFMFALAGIPPMAGFMGKFYIFMALINQGMTTVAILAIITTAIAAYFYIRIVKLMYMNDPEEEYQPVRSNALYLVVFVSVIAVILLGILPGYFMDLASRAALLL